MFLHIIDRKTAKSRGLKFYFTGKPCPKGHVCARRSQCGGCFDCGKHHSSESHAKNKEKRNARCREYHAKNRPKMLERMAAYGDKTKEVRLEKAALWRKENQEKRVAYEAKRRALKKESIGFFTSIDILRIMSLQRAKCANCGSLVGDRYHVDHINPLSRGGSNGPENIQILCPTCNHKKHAKDPIQWANENGKLL